MAMTDAPINDVPTRNARWRGRLLASVAGHLLAGAVAVVLAAWLFRYLGGLPASVPAAALATYALVAAAGLTGLGAHAPLVRFGPANRITLARGVLTSLVAGAIPAAAGIGTPMVWALSGAALLALMLDGVDGWLARRAAVSSGYGAAFDHNVDTVAMATLAVLVWRLGDVGAWVLLVGVLRPAYVLAGLAVPALVAPLPPSNRRRVVCAVQTAALVACLTPVLSPPLSSIAAGGSLALLIFSFSVDTVWSLRNRTARTH
ncbi:CDP-alcohol phosphatidyltransferase family protein [Arenibaculum sp.]|uniref:CDP-alcohol phosphatidyltransferase family protein n=1 Tax=Arenibaculum sp. TaxID=2865862 RepID=UPI002E0F8677|nr:CDP-alcohol phosphatidyltransferase family protein [Arenibaculum sp.]